MPKETDSKTLRERAEDTQKVMFEKASYYKKLEKDNPGNEEIKIKAEAIFNAYCMLETALREYNWAVEKVTKESEYVADMATKIKDEVAAEAIDGFCMTGMETWAGRYIAVVKSYSEQTKRLVTAVAMAANFIKFEHNFRQA